MVNKHRGLLFSKQSNGVTNNAKKKTWENICSKVNASNTDHSRSVEEIRKKWSTYMSNTKQKVAKIRREARKTGSGPPSEDISSLEDLVVGIIGDNPTDVIEGGIDTCMELPAGEGSSTAGSTISSILFQELILIG